jgi:hypothetical protein
MLLLCPLLPVHVMLVSKNPQSPFICTTYATSSCVLMRVETFLTIFCIQSVVLWTWLFRRNLTSKRTRAWHKARQTLRHSTQNEQRNETLSVSSKLSLVSSHIRTKSSCELLNLSFSLRLQWRVRPACFLHYLVSCLAHFSTPKMEAMYSSETFFCLRTTRS